MNTGSFFVSSLLVPSLFALVFGCSVSNAPGGGGNLGGSGGMPSSGGASSLGGAGGNSSGEECELVMHSAPKCLAKLCDELGCGTPESVYDERGCFKDCETDADCDEGQTCQERHYSPVSCESAENPCNCGFLGGDAKAMLCGPKP